VYIIFFIYYLHRWEEHEEKKEETTGPLLSSYYLLYHAVNENRKELYKEERKRKGKGTETTIAHQSRSSVPCGDRYYSPSEGRRNYGGKKKKRGSDTVPCRTGDRPYL